jgi:hypothetical protein
MSDEDKWIWVRENQDVGITVHLDNDDTYITFDAADNEDDDDGVLAIQFNGYLGWSDGVQSLLESLDIAHECV